MQGEEGETEAAHFLWHSSQCIRMQLWLLQKQQKNKNNKIRGVFPGQNSFLIFIGVYRQHYDEEQDNKIRNYL